jgi:carbamoyl-phosphate synthase large subunit
MKNKKYNFLLTNAKSQIITSTIYNLREEFNCNIIITGDNEDSIGYFLADTFYLIKADDEKTYLKKIIQICQEEHIEAIIPHTIKERILLMKNKHDFDMINVKILSSSVESIIKSNNKTEFFKICEEIGVPVAKYYVVNTLTDLEEKAKLLGYPEKKVIIKPVTAHGSRGFRILNKNIKLKDLFFQSRGEDQVESKLSSLKTILGKKFPDLIISEYLPGTEYTVDCLRQNEHTIIIPRTRDVVKSGLTAKGTVVENEEIITYAKKLAEKIDLTTVFGFQFKLDNEGVPKILECNPRIQGTMVMSTMCGANIIAMSVKMLLYEKVEAPVIDWNTKFYRIWSGMGIGTTKKVKTMDLSKNTNE